MKMCGVQQKDGLVLVPFMRVGCTLVAVSLAHQLYGVARLLSSLTLTLIKSMTMMQLKQRWTPTA